MAGLNPLLRLQQIDNRVLELEEELASLDGATPGAGAMEQAAKAMENAEARRRDAERLLKDAELQLAGVETAMKTSREKLYGGKITDAKELSQLERELEQLGRKREKLDEQVLRRMEEADALDAELRERRVAVAGEQAQVEKEKADRAQRRSVLARELEETRGKRAAAADAVDPDLLEKYHAIRKRLGGIAVARINENTCSGCFMMVPESAVQRVKAFELVQCGACGRILVS